jgi:hypothetical protein
MHVICPHCAKQLEFAGPAPKFCAFCGQRLGDGAPVSTIELEQEAVTLSPPSEAETLSPSAVSAATDDALEKIGPYRLVRPLGGGGMGTVYEAVDSNSGQRVAVKVVQREYASSHEAVNRFRQEGELASQLTHPRCVFVLAADEEQGRPYIVMELMTGSTLEDLVKKNGRLPPEEALRKIFDVIEGLQEAHQIGLVHRDVKPSNCFLEPDGRVKIGDFGLARSLLRDSRLTKTGTFLGTPLFASPEQIKMEKVDAQSDVYSVAATLYFLLTGKAPFQTGDAMASMARIVSDDPPSMRTLRPELPKALDKVVLRGLERDRKRRWRSLEEFHNRLLPFLPVEPSVGGLGLRFGAYLVDYLVVGGASQLLTLLYFLLLRLAPLPLTVAGLITGLAVDLTYYTVLEGRWGWSLGKRLLRLRVGTVSGNQPPGPGRALFRAGALHFLLNCGYTLSALLLVAYIPEDQRESGRWANRLEPFTISILFLQGAWFYLGLGLMVCTMRKRNGYRGLHEFLSGTRTYLLRWPKTRKRRSLSIRTLHLETTKPDGLPEKLGPYRIRGALRWTAHDQTLVAQDPQLGRTVWLWVRAATEPSLNEAWHTISRATRPRWLASATEGDRRWDAFVAPTGCPLHDLVDDGQPLSWAEFRPILEDLTEELQASCQDGTLPPTLTVDQVWLDPRGRVQLLVTPLLDKAEQIDRAPPGDNHYRALALLGEVAILGLEGQPRSEDGAPTGIRTPLPCHAADIINRLLAIPPGAGVVSGAPYRTVDEVQQDLAATQAEPVEITRWMRARQMARSAVYSFVPLCLVAFLAGVLFAVLTGQGEGFLTPVHILLLLLVLCVPVCVLIGVFRGTSIAVVRADGRKASRWRRLGRVLLAGGFVVSVFVLGGIGETVAENALRPGLALIGLALALLGGYVFLMLRTPDRAPHDYLTKTYLVPK